MKIVVTGGAGFIGSALVRRLIGETTADVTIVDKMTYAASEGALASVAASDRYTFLKADICDEDAMQRVFGETQPDLVMNLAAETHVDRSIEGPDAFVQTNIVGVQRLLSIARAYRDDLPDERAQDFRFLQISTDEVFGALGPEGTFTETSPYDPSSPYSASKAAADHLVRAWGRTYGLPVLITNCSNNYGPYQFPEKLIPLILLNALEGKPLPVYGDGAQIRDWLHVDDHARGLITVGLHGQPGETYAIGGSSERRNIDIVRQICAILDELRPADRPYENLIEFVEDRPGHDWRYAIDATKIEQELGWRPAYDFETGLAETVRWYLEREDWWRPIRERAYAGQRLGLKTSA